MISNISEQNQMPLRMPFYKHKPITKDDMERSKLVFDVVDRLDYDDVKSIIMQEMACHDVQEMLDEEMSMRDAFCESDAILARIKSILLEFRAAEKSGTPRMMQIDRSLAALEASHKH
jgi:hypothetical protein